MFGNTEATNASDYFTHLKAPTKFFNSGFTLGGPIVKSKLFFFGDYQRTIDNAGYVVRTTVPTMRMRQGDFGEVASRIYDPLTGDVNGNGRTAFANNIIPAERISPIARRLLAFDPRAQHRRRRSARTTIQQAQTREKTTDGFDTKVNYAMNEKDQTSFRLSFMRPVVFDPGPVRASTAALPTAASPAPAPTPAGAARARGRASSAPRRSSTCAAASTTTRTSPRPRATA